jgi:hypothetical protein
MLPLSAIKPLPTEEGLPPATKHLYKGGSHLTLEMVKPLSAGSAKPTENAGTAAGEQVSQR